MSTRLFFVSIWAAGTIAASSLGWTAVALVAQRVSDQPRIEALELLTPAAVKAFDDSSLGRIPALDRTGSSPLLHGFGSDSPTGAQGTSAELVFDRPWVIGDPDYRENAGVERVPTTEPAPAAARSNDVAGTIARVAGTPVASPVSLPVASPANTEPTAGEIHANPGKAFGISAGSTTTSSLLRMGSAADTIKSSNQTKPTKAPRPPTPLAPTVPNQPLTAKQPDEVAASGGVAVEQSESSSNKTPVPLSSPTNTPSSPSPSPALGELPPTLVVTAQNAGAPAAAVPPSVGPAPVVPTPPANPVAPQPLTVTPTVPATIAPSAIVISSAPPPATPNTRTSIAPAPINSAPVATAPLTTTKPVAIVQQAYQLSNGNVGVHCMGNQIVLDFATPSPGVTVKVDNSGPEKIELKFMSSGDSERTRSETEFTARCVGGNLTRGG